ncbi:MAG: tetratricopeptide repeat protein [Candidatus Kapabacteria bacterium]|nr:tetratricopeptide repeat protein [Candidatus Kapabacteria bacterium]
MMRRALLACLLVAASIPAAAQWVAMSTDADSLVQIGTKAVYNVEFDKAQDVFDEVIRRYPQHPAGYFLDAMIDWWRIAIGQRSQATEARFLSKLDKVITVCDANLTRNPKDISSMFFKGGALGYRGRFNATNNNMLSAAEDGRVALGLLNDCQKVAPGNHDILLGTGLYNYWASVLPEKYPALKPVMIFLPKGDKVIGLAQLKAAARQARYSAVEAKVVLVQAYFDFEKNALEAIDFARDLNQSYPRNPAFHRAYGRCLVSLGPIDSAAVVWRDVLNRCLDKWPGYNRNAAREALYYIGVSLMIRGDLDKALTYFYKCDEACRKIDEDATGFIIKTNLKIGQIYDMQGKRDLAIKQYKKLLAWSDNNGSHDDAQRYLATPYR